MEAKSVMKMEIEFELGSCAGYKCKVFSDVPKTPVIIESHVGKYYISGKNEKKQMEDISQLHPIEFINLIGHEYERSSSSEKMEEDRSQIIHFRKYHGIPRSKMKLGNKIKMNPIIKDFIISQEEYALVNELGKQVKTIGSWYSS